MDHKIVYSKTGKGVLEIKNKAGKLSRELAKVLGLVDGKSSVADLVAKSKLADADVSRVLKQLEERGYIKEFSSLSGVSGARSSSSFSGSSSYVDDLDFTKKLSPGKRVYSSSQAEMRARESAEREQAEADAKRKREDAEQKKKNQAALQAREEATRLARIEAERKSKEAAALKAKQEADRKKQQQDSEMQKTTRDLAKILEAERQALEISSRQKKEEQARKSKEDADRRAREDAERKRREDEERKIREEEERKRRKEEEERKRREDEERKIREEEERKRRKEEEDRKRREEEERKRREEEERKRREEEERKRREEEDRKRREEEERKRREEEDRKRREDEERKRREEEDRRREEEDRRREEEDRRREEDERRRREEEDRQREEEGRYASPAEETETPSFDVGDFDLPSISGLDETSESRFDLPETTPESDAGSSFDLPSFDANGSESFAADFDRQQELRRKQEEEEERRRQEAEEAHTAMERARREEEAREEAARRAAMEAEMRTRVEHEKADRAERQRAKEEEYKRKIEQEEERKRAEAEQREREEFQRTETERKKREEDLARRRRESEEADRKRSELKRLQKSGRIRSPVERARPFIIGIVLLVALVVGGIQIVPMSGYIPSVEKLVSESVGEPVTIGSMKMSVLSGLQFKFGNVNIGTTQDVSLNEVVVTPELGSLFGDKVRVTSIQADGGTVVREAVARLPDWLSESIASKRVEVREISLRNVKLEMRTFVLPALNADVNFRRDGGIIAARVATADGRLTVNISNDSGAPQVDITATNLTLPIGARMQLADFTGTGTINGSTLNVSAWDATVYGGQAKGSGQLSWSGRWRLTSQFEFARLETEQLLDAFSKTAKVTGSASGTGNLTAEAGNIDSLLDRPSLQSRFVVKKGTLDGVDLVRALQAGPGGTQGGSTRFEELKGGVSVSNGRYSYGDVELSAGILSASSNFSISGNQEVSGRVYVTLRSPAQRLSANLNITGTLKGITLRP